MTTSIISQIQARKMASLDSIFDQEYRENPSSFDVNPLVLSVRLKKIRDADPSQWFRLEDPSVKAALTGDDFNDAEAIKEYYSKKLMWTSLKDSRLSDFRTHLMSYLAHPKTMLTRKEVGMVVTLPYFYEEDQILDTIAKQYRVTGCPDVRPNLTKFTRELVYIHSSTRWVNRKKFIFYWFADDNQYVYNIQTEIGNPLREIFEDVVLTRPTNIFETRLNKVEYPFDYYKMFDYKLVKL